MEASYRFETAAAGNFTTKLSWSHQLEYDFTAIASDKLELAGTAGYPQDRGQLLLGWDKGDFNASFITNYISDSSDGTKAKSLPSWTTFDVQASVALPWNAKVTLGVRNLGNKMPPFNASLQSFPYYDNSLYNIWGRTPYMRYEQNF
ncbi:TonB dependent receptor [compost metagenome]